MKYNLMGINRDLCSQNSKLERNTRNPVVVLQAYVLSFLEVLSIILISQMFIITKVTLLLTTLLGIVNMLQVFWCR